MMGTPKPGEPDWSRLDGDILQAQVLLGVGVIAVGVTVLLVLFRALRRKHRPQMSLRLFVLVILGLSVCSWGGVRWRQVQATKVSVKTEYDAANLPFTLYPGAKSAPWRHRVEACQTCCRLQHMRTVLSLLLLVALGGPAVGAEYPLWDGKESVAAYAKPVGLPATKTINLGAGVKMEFVLIPAGKFIMGTPEPIEPDWSRLNGDMLQVQVLLGVGVIAVGVMVLLVLFRALRRKHRPQMSLRLFVLVILGLSVCSWGGVRWHQGVKAKSVAKAEYEAAKLRFDNAAHPEKPAHEVTLSKPFYMGKYEVTQEQYQQVIGNNPSAFKALQKPVETVSWDDARAFCQKVVSASGARTRLPSEAEWETDRHLLFRVFRLECWD